LEHSNLPIYFNYYDPLMQAFAFQNCDDVNLRRLTFVSSSKKYVCIYKATRVHVSGLTIIAPGDSPNTDGESQHVQVLNSNIGTGGLILKEILSI